MKNLSKEILRIQSMMNMINESEFEEKGEMVVDGKKTLESLQAAVRSGAKVTIQGDDEVKEVFKMPMMNLATFVGGGKIVLPKDGDELESVKHLIQVDGEPLELIYTLKPKVEPKIDTRTPEEIEKSKQDWMDRYGPGGGVDTDAGRYTGD